MPLESAVVECALLRRSAQSSAAPDTVCRGTNKNDQKMLEGFFDKMRGLLHAFRFDYGGVAHAPCRFASSTGPRLQLIL